MCDTSREESESFIGCLSLKSNEENERSAALICVSHPTPFSSGGVEKER